LEAENEKFIVLWQTHRRVRKPGLVNWLLNRTKMLTEPILFQYDDDEIAEYGYENIKRNGGYRPMLMKVIKE